MDQPTTDPTPTPDPSTGSQSQSAPQSASQSVPPSAPRSGREERVARRLQSRVETEEPLVAWTRGWVSKEMRMHGLLAARTLDFAVLTDRWLFLLNTGFFTRRPRRCVYAARLAEIFVSQEDATRGKRLRITSRKGRPLWFELRSNEQTDAFADALVARTRAAFEPQRPETHPPEPHRPEPHGPESA
jgi:hypothetical protein